MGFRLIKSDQKLPADKRVVLKKQELAKEAMRWVNLAGHTLKDWDQFVTHFEEVLRKNRFQEEEKSSSMSLLKLKIKESHKSLECIQGNLSLHHIDSLLTGTESGKSLT